MGEHRMQFQRAVKLKIFVFLSKEQSLVNVLMLSPSRWTNDKVLVERDEYWVLMVHKGYLAGISSSYRPIVQRDENTQH